MEGIFWCGTDGYSDVGPSISTSIMKNETCPESHSILSRACYFYFIGMVLYWFVCCTSSGYLNFKSFCILFVCWFILDVMKVLGGVILVEILGCTCWSYLVICPLYTVHSLYLFPLFQTKVHFLFFPFFFL